MTQIIYSLIFISVSVLIYWLVLPHKWRSAFLLILSLFFISIFSIKVTFYFLFNVILIYKAGTAMNQEGANRGRLIKLSLIWLIGSLCVFKYGDLLLNAILKLGIPLPLMPETGFIKFAMPLGISYIVFRLIHYIVEVYRKNVPAHTFTGLAMYVLFFPTFLSGPIDRFRNVHTQTSENKSFDPSDINYGLFRIISGMIKKFVVADNLIPLIMPLLASPGKSSRAIVILAIYGLAIQIYMDFSGYTDMALGVSRLYGYKIMENFNNPYFKKNIALFWRNWHMSVYGFIRDYFFFPFFGYKASQFKIYLGIFVTMIVFMLWHQGNLSFLILGVYHGSGLVIWQLFQEIKRKNPRIQKLVDNTYLDPVSTFITFSFVSFGYVLFTFDMGHASNIFHRVFL